MKRIMKFFLALVMFMAYLPLNPITSYADDRVEINKTNFPDYAFKDYVEMFDVNGDHKLSKLELDNVTEILIDGKSVWSLEGIEYFKNLKRLKCNWNYLKKLDLSHNPNLTYLDCGSNSLTELNLGGHKLETLNVSNNPNLKKLDCGGNKLTSLDVSGNYSLTELYCSNNQLESLNLGDNPNLTQLGCANNNLNTLNVSKNKKLTSLQCNGNQLESLNLDDNPNLARLYCSNNKLTSLNLIKNKNLTELWCDNNQLRKLSFTKDTELTKLDCSNNKLNSLDLYHIKKLTDLWCSNNQINSLQVWEGSDLTKLDCHNNNIFDLKVHTATKLTDLNCDNNKLKNLDVSNNTNLAELDCHNNKLNSLKLGDNKKLTKLNCFENKLESLDVSNNTNLAELDCHNNNLTSLKLGEDTNLTKLACNDNKLTSLDVSGNTNLAELACNDNKLENLDVSKNPNLTVFVCDNNNLDSLKLGNNTNLIILGCGNNKLTSLDVSGCTGLNVLVCTDNNLESLNLGGITKLVDLECNNNKLKNLDVSKNIELTELHCNNNNLTSLDVSSNKILTTLESSDQQYNITVNKDTREFKYSNFLGKFNKDKVTSHSGASFGNDALTVYSNNPSEVTYKYNVGKNKEMNVKLNVTYFDPENVEKMEVKTPPKLSYTEGDRLDLTGLVVKLTDTNKKTRDVAFKDFEENKIKVNPENNTELTAGHNNKAVKLTRGKLTAETNKLTVAKKVEVPDPAKPGTVTPDRVRVTFDAGDGNKIDGTNNRYKYIDVLTGTAWNDEKVKEQIPKSATYKDATQVFDKWDVPTTGNVEAKTFTADYKDVVKTGTDPNAQTPEGYTRVTFDAGEGNTIAGNRYKVIDVLTGTAWNDEKVKEQIPASAKYKDTTKVFKEWSEKVPTTGNVEAKTFTADYKDVVKIGTDPNVQVTEGYTRVTFDAGEGNTIAGTNDRYKVIDVLTGTVWNNAEVTKEIPASAKYKDNTKVFKEWSEKVPDTGEVQEQKFTAEYKDVVKIGTDPNAQVPDGYTRVTFDAGDGNTVAGTNDRYKVIDVLNGTTWNDAEVTKEIPASAKYKDTTKVFDKWNEAVPDTGEVQEQKFTAEYKDVVKTGTNPNAQAPDGYTRVTFDAGAGNTIAGNRYKVIDVLTGTTWDNTEVTKELPKSAKYKDNTKVFKEWSEAVPTTGTVDAAKTFTAVYKANKELKDAKTAALAELDKLDSLTNEEKASFKEEINKAQEKTKVSEALEQAKQKNTANKELKEAKEALKPIIEKKFQDPKQKASVLKDLAKLNTLFEVEQLRANIEGSATIGEYNDAKKLAAAKDKAVKTVKELKKLTEAEKTKAVAEINKANTEAEVNAALEKAKELDKKHGAENPSPAPTPDVTPSPDVTPAPETKAGWQKDEKGWWYLRENGTYPAGEWEPVGETWYHFDAQGYMQTGWLNQNGTWYYLNADGSMACDTWIGTYYVDANGAWVIEGWQNQGYGWWYQRANGTYPAGEWEMINGIWYYFDSNGYMLANETTPDGYYVDENGAWVK